MDIVNDHNVYILGAGFSVDAGLPLINNFLVQMRDSHEWLIQTCRHREAQAVNQVLQFRLEAASASYWVNMDLENIEDLFSLASTSAGNIAAQIRLAIAATLDYARKANGPLGRRIYIRDSNLFKGPGNCPNWVEPDSTYPVTKEESHYLTSLYAFYVARLLGMFIDGKPKGQNSFISFNYDTLLEDALEELSLPFTYGSCIPGPQAGPDSSIPPIPVMKLHGSINWARSNGCQGLKVTQQPNEFIAAPNIVPELIPPTWKKVFENQLESIWSDAIRTLSTATRIIVIGFSMPPTDMHFKYLLAAGLQKNVSLRQIHFVNPDKENLEQRARDILRKAYVDSNRISFHTCNLQGFTETYGRNDGKSTLDAISRPTERGASYSLFSV